MTDKVLTKVVKGENIEAKFYDPETDKDVVVSGFVPYVDLPDNEVFNYFKNNINTSDMKPLSIVKREPHKVKWQMPYQEWSKRMNMDIDIDTATLKQLLSSLER